MRESDQCGYYGIRDVLVMASSLNEVDIVLELKEWACYGPSTVVHVAQIVIEAWHLLDEVLSLP